MRSARDIDFAKLLIFRMVNLLTMRASIILCRLARFTASTVRFDKTHHMGQAMHYLPFYTKIRIYN